MHAKISHKQYGICKIPAQKDCLKKSNVIIITSKVKTTQTANAVSKFFSIKNICVQLRFIISWTTNIVSAKNLFFELGLRAIRTKDVAINKYKIGQTIPKVMAGGAKDGLFSIP